MSWTSTTMVRGEGLQTRELVDLLTLPDNASVEGAFVFLFVWQVNPYDGNPRCDMDMASYNLVVTFAVRPGTTYPEMSWEPTESFKAVADYCDKH